MGIGAQETGADGMEGAGPANAHVSRCWAQRCLDDALGAALHFGCSPTRKSQEKHATGFGAIDDQMGNAVRQRVGLTRAGSRYVQERVSDIGAVTSDAV